MKRQFLLLILGLASAVQFSNAQTCGDALHPMAGQSYTYTVTTNPAGGTFNWYVTSDPNLITGAAIPSGGGILVAGTGYNDPASTSASVDIIWSSQAVAAALSGTKYYLVVKYTTDCSNNLKPWIIQPMNLFEITVENIASDGSAYADICRSEVIGATVDPADNMVVYDYGENALYLKVTAKGFTTSWTPRIDMTALNASITSPQVITSIEWSLTTTFTGTSNFDLGTGIATAAVPDKNGDNITSGTDEFIFIKIVIDDGKFEGLANQSIALNISATDAATNPDVDVDGSCNAIAENDQLTQVLKARPSLTNPVPSPFLSPK